MRFRALFLGLVGAVFMTGFGYVGQFVLNLPSLVDGHLLPISVIGTLVLFVALVNPLLFRLHPRLGLRPAELAVVTTMMMVACSIPARGLMEQFTTVLAMPRHFYQNNEGWKKNDLMGYVPPPMVAGDSPTDPDVLDGFLQGKAQGREFIGLSDVPWAKWTRTLSTWMPLVGLLAVIMVCIGLIVHRQWSQHERLRYPIPDTISLLTHQDPGRATGPVLRSRLFWIGLAVVLAIHLVNGNYVWNQGSISIPLQFDLGIVGQKWTSLPRAHRWGNQLLLPTLYPMVVGFSYFLASEISLSLGLSQWLYLPVALWFLYEGVDTSEGYMAGGGIAWQRFGSYLAFALIILYCGRRHYRDVLKGALLARRGEALGYEVWAFRILLAALAGMIAIIVYLGLDWTLALIFVALMLLMFLCVARISAETGLFFIQPRWQPVGAMLGLFGAFAIGPKALIILGLLCAVLCIDPSQSLIGYFVNSLKLCSNARVSAPRVGWAAIATFAAGVAVAVPVVLWANYNFGVPQDFWSHERVPTMTFRMADTEVNRLSSEGRLAESRQLDPLGRLAQISPKPRFLYFAGAGFLVVLIVSALRLRLSWWPLHPVVFLLWMTWPMTAMHHSFLLGWIVKTLVVRLGGMRVYEKYKPMMIGVIAGDLLGGLVFIVIGWAYYFVTGLEPESYFILPR